MSARERDDRRKVLIAGAGVGGLEAALALRAHAGDRVRVDLLAPERHFIYRPLSVGEPFDRARTVQAELGEIAEDRGFGLVRDAVARVDADAKQVVTQGGRVISYDDLVLSLGARPQTAVHNALTFRGPRDVERLRAALEEVAERPAPVITFVAGKSATWTLPLYELALLTRHWATERGLAADIRIVTSEDCPLQAFGPASSHQVASLLASRGIAVRTATDPGHVVVDLVVADLVVALPDLRGPATEGLPLDGFGFVPVDDFCRVQGMSNVYAIGDMTQHTVKQGGLAAQMADVAAAVIARDAGAPVQPEPFRPVLRAMLFTGELPLYLRNPPVSHMPHPADDGAVSPWWPAHKIAGAHLAPYLATHADLLVPVPAAA